MGTLDVIILAGGFGTRLRSSVRDVPKCLAPVGDHPFLQYVMTWLSMSQTRIGRVVLSVGYLKEAVFDWVEGHRRDFPFEIDFAVEEEPLGTGGGIRLALGRCHSDEVLVLNGDTFFNVDIGFFLEKVHARPEVPAITLALKPLEDFDRYGEVILENGLVAEFKEKAPCRRGLVNGGVYLAGREALSGLMSSLSSRFSFEEDVLSHTDPLGGVVCDSYFIDIGIPEDYSRAQVEIPAVMSIMEAARKAIHYGTVFLDRDGVINRLIPGDYARNWGQFDFRPGIFDALRLIAARPGKVFLVTNQRGVGRGLMSQEDLDDIHRKMLAEIHGHGGKIDGIYAAVSADKNDPMRKPNEGMYKAARKDYPEIDPADSVMIGDDDRDRDFASACGMDFIRVTPFR